MTKPVKYAGFTICSNNYLGQALALKRSFLAHHPNFEFWIVVVDKPHQAIDYKAFEPAKLIYVADIPGVELQELLDKYYIIELNTAIKPSAFKYIKTLSSDLEQLYYLDPDLYFYGSLDHCQNLLEEAAAVLTPHVLSPIPRDGSLPDENVFLQFGIYNLGFLGLNMNHSSTLRLLDWWEHRCLNFGFDQANKGYFVDQLWMALAPIFYTDIVVLKELGYNMAPWNLHERQLKQFNKEGVLLNDDSKLVFYHFSKITANEAEISREFNRYSFKDFPLLLTMYKAYYQVLEQFNYWEYKQIPIAYSLKPMPGTATKLNVNKAAAKRSFYKRLRSKLKRISES